MYALSEKKLSEVVVAVRKVIDLACQLPEAGCKRGGYFCLAPTHTGFPYLLMLVGLVPQDKFEKYAKLAMEKARRLSMHPHHITSRESRNPEKEEWGGAVFVNPDIWSFSGFPERLDEAVMIVAATKMGNLSNHHMRHLAGMFGVDPNPFWPFIEKHAVFS